MRGDIIATELETLKKIRGSKLEWMFSGKFVLEKDLDGAIKLDFDPDIFKHVINYLESDRTKLPPNTNPVLRKKVMDDIKESGLDKGLAKSDSLTTQSAVDFQKVLNCKPDLSHCKS